jgi:predicted N-acetyltransferase YhbS
MLFVKTSHMGLGIASALFARAEEASRAAGRPKLTVHSSLNAQTFYQRLGFVAKSEPQQVHGFTFLSMEKEL